MFSRTRTMKSTAGSWDEIARLKGEMDSADAIVIGAGSGLSTSAGFTYTGSRFEENFGDFIEKYGFRDMYSGGFYPFKTQEEYWAYWSRYIWINRYQDAPKDTYQQLFRLVEEKEYFVLTTNVDHCFQKAGFDKNAAFLHPGGLRTVAVRPGPAINRTYDNEETVRKMVKQQRDMRVPSELVPRCPVCGAP